MCYVSIFVLFPVLVSCNVVADQNSDISIKPMGNVVLISEEPLLVLVVKSQHISDDVHDIFVTKSTNSCERIGSVAVLHGDGPSNLVIVVPAEHRTRNESLYFCVRRDCSSEWRHAGRDVFVSGAKSQWSRRRRRRRRRCRRETDAEWQPVVTGLRVDHSRSEPLLAEDGSGVPELLSGVKSKIRIFGSNLTNDTWVTFTREKGERGGSCQLTASDQFQVSVDAADGTSGFITVHLEAGSGQDAHKPLFVCVKNELPHNTNAIRKATDVVPYMHQGSVFWLQVRTYQKLLPLGVSVLIIMICLLFSALFSGLNLGLMSLDRTELKILCNTGNETERRYARAIKPVRDHGNYLLCSILLGNVLVNSIFTILLDELTSGIFAVVFATLAIVMFGEISPQALCSRHGLAVGYRTILITKAVMIITFPLSYPISKVLDCILGEEIGNVYNRERLKELVKVTNDINDLDRDEVNIISGALELRKKTVVDVMTRIEDVFMLDYEAVLDFETVSEIMKSGFSRIPVYEGRRTNIVTLLYIKDLAFVDPDDNTPLKTLCQFYQNPCNFVFEDTTLDVMFRQFKEGNKGHMVFVTRVNSEGEGDPFYETIGLVTLEDVIEELIQAEIVDETDVFTDNRSKRRRLQGRGKRQDFSMFAERRENQRIHVSPQLTLATYQYLSTSLEIFRQDYISETTLRRLLKQDVFRHAKRPKRRPTTPNELVGDGEVYLYKQGIAADYFILVLEGRVEVTVGRENLIFEAGPFSYFGLQALTGGGATGAESPASQLGSLQSLNMEAMQRYQFQPDYTVRVLADVLYLRVPRPLYLAAKRATLMERSQPNRTQTEDDDEVDKLLALDNTEEPPPANGPVAATSTPAKTAPSPPPTAAPPSPRIPGAGGDADGDVPLHVNAETLLLSTNT